MNRGMMMAMMANRQRSEKGRRVGVEYEDWGIHNNFNPNRRGRPDQLYGRDNPRSEYNYRADNRFRDRDGREHYDNGRFAPENDGGYWVDSSYGIPEQYQTGNPMSRYPARNLPYNWYDSNRHGGEYNMPMIGFSGGDGFRQDSGMDASYRPQNEMAYRQGMVSPGHSETGAVMPMDRQRAEQWAARMENTDGTRGPHWSMDQTEQVRSKHNIECDPVNFWVAINLMYSDYCRVAEKLGVNSAEFYACMAKAFLEDKDAQPEKLARYYEFIAKH